MWFKVWNIPSSLSDFSAELIAWDIAVTLMECGEVAKVKSAPRFAYGEHGKKSIVPPNATITYELELLEVQEPVDLGCISEEELSKIV